MISNKGRSNSGASKFSNQTAKLICEAGLGVFINISKGWLVEVKSSGIGTKSREEDLESTS